MATGFNGTQTILDIPAGGTVNVLATGLVVRLTVVESGKTSGGAANTAIGLNYKIPNDGTASGFTTIFTTGPNVPIVLGVPLGESVHHGMPLGNGPGFTVGIGPTGATVLCQVSSATGAATSIQVRQDY